MCETADAFERRFDNAQSEFGANGNLFDSPSCEIIEHFEDFASGRPRVRNSLEDDRVSANKNS